MRRRVRVGFVLAIALLSGCATNGLADVPLPAGDSTGSGYRLSLVFADALNLHEHAKVKIGGADVGQVEDLRAQRFTAVVTVRIGTGVDVPAGTKAELRTATPLGDVFVSLIRPPAPTPGGRRLVDGDVIGTDATSVAASVESVLTSSALLVNGGAVHNLVNVVNGAGKAVGPDGRAFGDLVAKSNDLLAEVNSRSNQIDSAMAQTARLANALEAKNTEIAELLAAANPATRTLADTTGSAGQLVQILGGAASSLRKFPSVAGTDTSGRSIIADAGTISAAFNDVSTDPQSSLSTFAKLYAPFVKITAGTSISGSAGIDRLVLGSIPDAGFGGDPGLHGPRRVDARQLVGSLKYVLFRLQERVVGKGP